MPTEPSTPVEPPFIDVEILGADGPDALDGGELTDLRRARRLLSGPGAAIRFAHLVGTPIERGLAMLPAGASRLVNGATRLALGQALRLALRSLGTSPRTKPDNSFHKLLAATSGALGGAFGIGTLFVELPVSTTLILRSIAQIAASQGHSLRDAQTRLACLEVFALGGDTSADNAAETSYWAVRAALAKLVSEAAGLAASRGAAAESAPAVIRLITAIAARFGVIVSEQVAAKAVPVLGAAAGAAINVVFMDHFQKMAEGHFIVRRLESLHGTDTVRRAYESLAVSDLS